MNIGFQFEVIYKAEDLIEIRISAWNGSFGGTTDLYLGIDRLEEIATQLRGFPASPTDSREITLGAFGPGSAGGVSMKFYCADASGHAYVESKIESGSLSGKPVQSALLSLAVEAAAVDSFVEELSRLKERGIACLDGVAAEASSADLRW